MLSHSEEVWESFDCLWRRVEALSRQVKELESRLAMLEASDAGSPEELKLTRAHYEGETKQ
jgi:hypothetical protein